VAGLALLVMASSVPLYQLVRQEYLPSNVDEGEFDVRVSLPEGTGLGVVNDVATKIEAELSQVPGIQYVLTSVGKYFNRATDAVVTVAKNGGGVGIEVDCLVHLPSGISLQAEGHGGDAHSAFGDAIEKLEKRVRRYKRRLRNHHADNKSPLPAEDAAAYVLAPLMEESDAGEDVSEPADDPPLVIAEATVPVRTMTVSMAVMQLDLGESPALLFRNAGHGGLNVVYRRADGNIGWVDPERDQART
jgi:ribosomal subunit interface protein